MGAFPTLRDYAAFITKIKENRTAGMPIEKAVDEAVNHCIQEDILKEYLTKHKAEVKGMILTEYDENETMQLFYQDGQEDGIRQGIRQGRSEGISQGETKLASLIQKLISAGRSSDISKVTSDNKYKEKLYKEFNITDQKS